MIPIPAIVSSDLTESSLNFNVQPTEPEHLKKSFCEMNACKGFEIPDLRLKGAFTVDKDKRQISQ